MNKLNILLLLLIVNGGVSLAQTKIGDVVLQDEIILEGKTMSLNGAGTRIKMWKDLYVGGLYLQTKSNNSQEIITSDTPMVIKLQIISSLVTQEKMIAAFEEGFEKSSFGSASEAEKTHFISCFKNEIKEGDVFDLRYIDKNVKVFKNGKEKGHVSGLEFKKALFGIWLGKKAADKDLKNAMLGK